ncbi:MAG: HAD family phosphatase [Lachnospiraceae bacterium]|nr:HAD family phosphatase [Lachnospiraceae bacterium]
MSKSDMKLLFFDIDGTLITDDGTRTFPESAKEAIRLARKNGHKTFINTGRVMVNVEDFIREPGFDGYVCGCGTHIQVNGEDIFHHTLSWERCNEIAHKCRDMGMMAIFEYISHTGYDQTIQGTAHREILDYFIAMKRKLVRDIDGEDFVFDKFTAWYEEDNPYVEEFKEYLKDEFLVIQREGNFIEVVPKGFSKATGIEYLAKYYDVSLDNIFVFGDSNNDLEMLQYVPNSIAMGKCTKEVADISSYRTDTVENHGIYKAMKHFGVI